MFVRSIEHGARTGQPLMAMPGIREARLATWVAVIRSLSRCRGACMCPGQAPVGRRRSARSGLRVWRGVPVDLGAVQGRCDGVGEHHRGPEHDRPAHTIVPQRLVGTRSTDVEPLAAEPLFGWSLVPSRASSLEPRTASTRANGRARWWQIRNRSAGCRRQRPRLERMLVTDLESNG